MSDYVYLDWAASAPVCYFAKDYYVPGNPNSQHNAGLQANQALNEARQRIIDCLGVKSGKVLFCRCATEAVEWLHKVIDKGRIFSQMSCSKYEHDSVYDLGIAKNNWEDITKRYTTPLIYLHQYINQLTGTVFPIESIGKQVQSTSTFFGSDFTAAIGHYPIPENLDSFCDAVWFSGHKFGCEPGIGAIWLSDKLFKYLGGSEDSRNDYGLLHGTPNVSAAVAMSYAMEHAIKNLDNKQKHWELYLSYLIDKLYSNGVDVNVVCGEKTKTYAINALYLPNINADALTQYLSTKSIYISPGHSACADNDDYRVLEAFGLTKEQASQTVRISFGEDTSMEDIDALVNGIVEFKKLFV